MRSDFDDRCRGARELMPVPAIPLAAIRNAAAAEFRPHELLGYGKRRKGLITALLAGVSVAAVAAGAGVLSGTHVFFNLSGPTQLSTDRLDRTKDPTAEDLRSAARHADFPVVLPAGLPAGTTPTELLTAGPSALLLQYNLPGAWRRSNHILDIVLANPETLGSSPKRARGTYSLEICGICSKVNPQALRVGGVAAHEGLQWLIGHEGVIVLRSTLTPAELAHVKNAMIAQSERPDAAH